MRETLQNPSVCLQAVPELSGEGVGEPVLVIQGHIRG